MVRADTVARLLEAARAARASLTVPIHGGKRGHPAIFGVALFSELADPGLVGGARTVVHRHLQDALKLDVDDPGVLVDIDTPDAYRQVVG
jgi:molybdenum cofactor cytidylyltransferase